MTLQQIIADIPFLKPHTSVDKALRIMEEEMVHHLPVVDEGKLLGLVSMHDLDEAASDEDEVIDYLPVIPTQALQDSRHIYDALKIMTEHKISALPVITAAGEYKGLITIETMLRYFADSQAVTQPGGVIVLSMASRDFSLSAIARIIESENTRILSSLISSPYGSESLELTLKLNRHDLSHVIATLERFGYEVQASYQETDYTGFLRERYDSLMNYLNV